MENFALSPVLPGENTDFSRGIYIILFEADKIPPHLLLSVNGKVFSITASGRQLGSPLEKLLLFIKRKNIAALFVEVGIPGGRTAENLQESARVNFSSYDRVVEGKISCLFPLRDFAAELFGNEMRKADFIFELLPLLGKQNATGNVYELNMQHLIANGKFELLTYTQDQLKEALQAVNAENRLS